nr:type II toxin-antitoxin system death-on-curing family toxin [Brevundimonas diminuta]
MRNEPGWLTPEGLIHINKRMVAATGEPHLLRSAALLESALSRPRNLWHYEGVDDIAVLATSLLFGVAGNHPFAQGNKRTAFTAAIGFLGLNDWAFVLVDDRNCAEHIIAVINGEATEQSFSDHLRECICQANAW